MLFQVAEKASFEALAKAWEQCAEAVRDCAEELQERVEEQEREAAEAIRLLNAEVARLRGEIGARGVSPFLAAGVADAADGAHLVMGEVEAPDALGAVQEPPQVRTFPLNS